MKQLFAAVLLAFAACGGDSVVDQPAARAPRVGPLTPLDPARLPPEQAEAIVDLAAAASASTPGSDSGHHGHGSAGIESTVPLAAADRATFDDQWAEAAAAARDLDSWEEAQAAGYVRAAVQGAGVGVHWVNWTLVDAPFDPARPSMLLFDEREGRVALVGFSYWVRADAPDGFAGGTDVWHRHTNLCIVNGWVDREGVSSAEQCAGALLAGSDLWMLHAWVVPGLENRWGDFATLHPALCPGPDGRPDIARCPEP